MGWCWTVQEHVGASCDVSVCRPRSCSVPRWCGVNSIVHSSCRTLEFGSLSVPMLSSNPINSYSIAKSLIFAVIAN